MKEQRAVAVTSSPLKERLGEVEALLELFSGEKWKADNRKKRHIDKIQIIWKRAMKLTP
jgi:hypothetical protein